MGIENRVAIITGSASGMGKQTARRMAENGVRVVINDIVQEKVDETVAEFKASGFEVMGVVADIADKQQVEAMVADTVAAFGAIDILVNNAGMEKIAPLRKVTEENWDLIQKVNLKGAFLCSQAVHGHMVEQKHGRIVNIASRAWLGGAGQVGYSSAKAGLVGLTRVLALELGSKNITANCIAPGLIYTPMWDSAPQKTIDALLKKQPTGTFGEPDDVAHAVMFFADDDSSYVTGQVFYVCGGRSLYAG
ncbi:3-ketoacyl-ACP reductase [Desulfosarcina ovata subsp. sediminis]|uniref:3-ketoacyl-ACP reductase n=1 Tax=Desulfosarcina ovata subsp. sediminis TaxID=885957 RepID=A0A5K7ZFZ0_9BACT|nr:3-oxoacyl-ACP reductase FabG [Desulfosarcina ovata]BBO80992.1 3-ketoacyl-ACP reductase [Desulfosarcina ovata subsp. sediminis]